MMEEKRCRKLYSLFTVKMFLHHLLLTWAINHSSCEGEICFFHRKMRAHEMQESTIKSRRKRRRREWRGNKIDDDTTRARGESWKMFCIKEMERGGFSESSVNKWWSSWRRWQDMYRTQWQWWLQLCGHRAGRKQICRRHRAKEEKEEKEQDREGGWSIDQSNSSCKRVVILTHFTFYWHTQEGYTAAVQLLMRVNDHLIQWKTFQCALNFFGALLLPPALFVCVSLSLPLAPLLIIWPQLSLAHTRYNCILSHEGAHASDLSMAHWHFNGTHYQLFFPLLFTPCGRVWAMALSSIVTGRFKMQLFYPLPLQLSSLYTAFKRHRDGERESERDAVEWQKHRAREEGVLELCRGTHKAERCSTLTDTFRLIQVSFTGKVLQ